MKKNNGPIIKPFYLISDIAKYIGYTSKGTRGFIMRLNIPIHLIGNRYIIYLCDLQNYTPELYNSILESENLNCIIKQKQKEDEDEDYLCKDQFTK